MNKYNDLDTTKLNYIIYCRRSSEDNEDRQVQSLETQFRELREHADKNKLNIVDIISESKSAFKVGREGFNKMTDLVRTKKANAILVIRGNRISRNPIDAGYIISLMDEKKLLYIRTPHSTCYTSSSTDKMMLALELIFSKKDSDDKGDMVKEGLKTKALKGLPSGVAALGFLNDQTGEKGNRNWKVDELRLKSIKILLDLFLTGRYSAAKIHAYSVNELKLTTVKRKRIGGALISLSRIYPLLTDTIYAGFFYRDGERYELSKHLPRLITEEQHNKIKIILSKRNIPKIQTHEVLYSGFMSSDEGDFMGQDVKFQLICDCKKKFSYRSRADCPVCGAKISKLKNPKYLSYTFYYNVRKKRNSEKYRSISEIKVDKKFKNFIEDNLNFSKELADWSKKHIIELKNKDLNDSIFKEQLKQSNEETFKKKAKRLRDMLRDEQTTEEEYKTDLEALNLEYGSSDKKENQVDWFKEMNEIADLTLCAKEIVDSDDFEEKRNLMSKLGSNLVWDEKELSILNRKSIQTLVDGIKKIKQEHKEFEPRNYQVTQSSNEKIGHSDPIFSSLLRG